MKLLALETSTEFCSVALWNDGAIAAAQVAAGREHTRLLLPLAQELLSQQSISLAALDGIAFGRGPGGFTGLRIAAGLAQGLGLSLNRPVIPVSTLAALAMQAHRHHASSRVLAVLDARLEEVYWAWHEFDAAGGLVAQSEEQLSAATAVRLTVRGGWTGIGSGWLKHAQALQQNCGDLIQRIDATAVPSAEDIARLAAQLWQRDLQAALPAEQALPVYLRNRVTQR
ncbi:MAG: tRNA (adenosine(37)-N6)-threonylcarbamoyltransferase complex dimerization subunit type 1 TsaB [Nevskiales bacterium]